MIPAAMMYYMPSFVRTHSGIQKLIGEDTQTHKTHRQQGDLISLFLFIYFFKTRKVG
jgi:hypothetical protein